MGRSKIVERVVDLGVALEVVGDRGDVVDGDLLAR